MAPRLEDLLSDALGIADVVKLADPVDRFRALKDLDDQPRRIAALLRGERSRAIQEIRARDPQPTWAEIGTLLGISGERARTLHDEPIKETRSA